MTQLLRFVCLFCLCAASLGMQAEEVTYRIVEYNADAADFTLASCGQKPAGSWVYFENDYGATRGNRYNQIPRNRQATLWLMGWEGCTIRRITLSMCSNNKAGSVALNVAAGNEVLYTMGAVPFNDASWYGEWVSKDHGIYVDIARDMTTQCPVPADTDVSITIKGGTQEGSVYLDAVTIDYTPSPTATLESPLGFCFEKLEAKSTLADGDVVMLYRSGDAAGDIDGMQTSHYLDAIGIASTADVHEPFVTFFTAHTTTDGHWTLTNAEGQLLGAEASQSLAWDKGVTTWDITLGYSGATITSTNSKYGSLRYNAPSGGYPRFWNYTSQSLPLPYLYRLLRQLEPTISSQLLLAAKERHVALSEQDTVVLRHRLLPASTTDRHVLWSTSDANVASVRDGIVHLHTPGTALITATSRDGGSTATCLLQVTETPEGITAPLIPEQASDDGHLPSSHPYYELSGRLSATTPARGIYISPNRQKHVH